METQSVQSSQEKSPTRSKPPVLFDLLEAEVSAQQIAEQPAARGVNRLASIIIRNCTGSELEEIRNLAGAILLTGDPNQRREFADDIVVMLRPHTTREPD